MEKLAASDFLVIREFRRQVEADPRSFDARLNLAIALFKSDEVPEALANARAAVELNPSEGMAHELVGKCLQLMGQFDDAVVTFSHAMALRPKRLANYTGYIDSKKITERDGPVLERLKAILKDPSLPPVGAKTIHFSLGKAYNDLGDYEQAMRHYDESHRLSKKHPEVCKRPVGVRDFVAAFEHMTGVFTSEFMSRHQGIGLESDLPVLIVGMPRSGTTLVEQILSSHANIGAGGELSFWRDHTLAFYEDPPYDKISPDKAHEVALEYRRLLRSIAPKMLRVTDKLPVNYLLLGPIQLMFPNARIVHCLRHPVDTCLSIYMSLPENDHDKADMVTVYRLYERIMDHWRSVLPSDKMLEVRYEELVEDRERTTRQLIDFIGLQWDDACLSHEKNERKVDTPSKWQVRQPIYRTSVDRWRRYGPWLGELRQLLTDEELASL